MALSGLSFQNKTRNVNHVLRWSKAEEIDMVHFDTVFHNDEIKSDI